MELKMKRLTKQVVLAALLAMLGTGVVLARLPDGWTFHCSGTTGVYEGPNGSYIYASNHWACD